MKYLPDQGHFHLAHPSSPMVDPWLTLVTRVTELLDWPWASHARGVAVTPLSAPAFWPGCSLCVPRGTPALELDSQPTTYECRPHVRRLHSREGKQGMGEKMLGGEFADRCGSVLHPSYLHVARHTLSISILWSRADSLLVSAQNFGQGDKAANESRPPNGTIIQSLPPLPLLLPCRRRRDAAYVLTGLTYQPYWCHARSMNMDAAACRNSDVVGVGPGNVDWTAPSAVHPNREQERTRVGWPARSNYNAAMVMHAATVGL